MENDIIEHAVQACYPGTRRSGAQFTDVAQITAFRTIGRFDEKVVMAEAGGVENMAARRAGGQYFCFVTGALFSFARRRYKIFNVWLDVGHYLRPPVPLPGAVGDPVRRAAVPRPRERG
jgi:hypothetical protein